MSVEIEREKTYLASRVPDNLTIDNSIVIRDIYIPEHSSHASLRLRQKGDTYEMTKKIQVIQGDSSRQTEHTIPLSVDEFDALASCSTKSLRKRRYYTQIEGHNAEVDMYEDALQGLIVIDFEFMSDTELGDFAQPEVALADVTQDEIVGGGFLAGRSYADIEDGLKKYGYERIIA